MSSCLVSCFRHVAQSLLDFLVFQTSFRKRLFNIQTRTALHGAAVYLLHVGISMDMNGKRYIGARD